MTIIQLRKRKDSIFIKIKEFHENGNLRKEVRLKNGNYHGLYKEYYDNGYIKKVVHYKEHKKNGYYKLFYENGYLNIKIPYRLGIINGNIKYYYDNGILGIQTSYRSNKKNGKMKFYDKEGNLYLLKTFKDNIQNGKEIEYFNFMEIHRMYKDGKKYGLEKLFLKINNSFYLFKEIYWKNNIKNGKTIFYDIDEKIKTIIPYRDGKIHGYKKVFLAGELEYKILYKNGRVIYQFQYSGNKDICVVCYESISYQTKCNHFICKSCFYQILNNKCPICRSILY